MSLREEEMKNVLIVHMFGSFSLDYNGKMITGRSKSSENQFNYLMQLLLHERDRGVSKNLLVSTLFASREINNTSHAMHSVIYNAKKRLSAAGMPEENCIVQKEGAYYFESSVPVYEDAREFENLIAKAENETDTQKKTEYLQSAVHLYVGDFLENLVSVSWVARESWRYRKMFEEAVGELADLLRAQGQFAQLEDLGRYASRIQPFCDWECLTMEGLVQMGSYDEALKLNEETGELNQYEQGIRPSDRMHEMLMKLGNQIEHTVGLLDDIQGDLEEEEEERGGYLCSYPVFMGIYRAVSRISERGGQSAYLMLCTIVDTKGNPMVKGSNLEGYGERLEEAIRSTIRRSDVMNRYNKSQFLVLLTNTTMESCQIIEKRINAKFIINRQQVSVKYLVNPVW